jgi:MFS family permease
MVGVFFGWRIVCLAFAIAFFAFGVGFYGVGVYLVALHARHGWPIASISLAITAYYVLGAAVTAVVGDAFERLGPRRVVAVAVSALAVGTLALPHLGRPWHLYGALAVMAVGWGGTSGAAINAVVAPWFSRRRGLAVSLAMNGATAGGAVMVPVLTALIAAVGFSSATAIVVSAMVVILLPLVFWLLHPGPAHLGLRPDGDAAPPGRPAHSPGPAPPLRRAQLIRSGHFWTLSAPFALGLFAQVAFLTHQMALLTPRLGGHRAALAVSLTALAAIVGRVLAGLVADRADRRIVGCANFVVQAAAVAVLITDPPAPALYAASALFGLGVGNMTTFPALIVQAEYPAEHGSRIVSLVVAINQFTFAFGPGVLGALRDWSGAYESALVACIACELTAAVVVLLGRRCPFVNNPG